MISCMPGKSGVPLAKSLAQGRGSRLTVATGAKTQNVSTQPGAWLRGARKPGRTRVSLRLLTWSDDGHHNSFSV
jgi:hypothetical protein